MRALFGVCCMVSAANAGAIDFAALPTNTWVEVDVPLTAPDNTPYKTNWSGAVFDTYRHQLVMYERYVDADNAQYFYSNAFWGFDADTGSWVLRQQSPWHNTGYCTLTNAGEPHDFPWDRHPYNQMAFDPDTSTLYLYGGPSYNCFGTDDTTHVWLLHTDSDTWESKQPVALPTVYNFYEGTFALDSSRGRIASSVIEDSTLWQYDLANNAWSPLAAPPALAMHQDQLGLIYAAGVDKLVAFGGHTYGQPGSAETYELDVATDAWQLLAPSQSPPARFSAGFAYSPDHELALLYGGHADDTTLLSDTWLFDVRTDMWTRVDTIGPHVDNVDVPLAYDSVHHVFMLPAGDYTYSQMWLFKPDAEIVAPSGARSPGGCSAADGSVASGIVLLVLLSRRRRRLASLPLLLLGCGRLGFDESAGDKLGPDAVVRGAIDFAGMPSGWNRITIPYDAPDNTPYVTGWSGGFYDSYRHQVMIYERYVDAQNAGFTYSNALWGFDTDAGRWVLRQQSPWHNSGYCSIDNVGEVHDFPWDRQPSGQMAYDAATATMYMYGGPSFKCFGSDDTTHVWLLHSDTDTWESKLPAALPATYDFYEGTFALDDANHRIISSVISSTAMWQYDLARNTWASLGVPPTLASHQDALGMVYASAAHEVVAFGGHTYGQPGSAETYVMDVTNDVWQQLAPATSPPARYGMGFAYSADRNVALLYGGHADDATVLDDTWLFDVAAQSWTRIDSPGPRVANPDVPLVYDTDHRVFVLPVAPTSGYVYSEIWVFKM